MKRPMRLAPPHMLSAEYDLTEVWSGYCAM
jgi:hypothetical protein